MKQTEMQKRLSQLSAHVRLEMPGEDDDLDAWQEVLNHRLEWHIKWTLWHERLAGPICNLETRKRINHTRLRREFFDELDQIFGERF